MQLAKQRELDPTNLYFANLPLDVDENILNEMLKIRFNANITSTRIMRERNGDSKGVGFARIDNYKLCDCIIFELNGKPFPAHPNQSKILLVKLADFDQNLINNGFYKSFPINCETSRKLDLLGSNNESVNIFSSQFSAFFKTK